MPTAPWSQPIALRIELLDVAPLVWRRVLVSNQWTLGSLHGYLQWVMGWTDSHAHEVEIGAGIVAPDWWIREADFDTDTRDYRDDRYDMGDGWQHRLVIESLPRVAETQDLSLPACLAGENACPPEDVGGPGGYELFLEILADRAHEQHHEVCAKRAQTGSATVVRSPAKARSATPVCPE